MEIWKGSRGETADERYGARGYDQQPEDGYARFARLEGFPLAFPQSFALSFPRRISIILHPLSRGNVTRQPLNKVRSVRVNETPLRHFFVG